MHALINTLGLFLLQLSENAECECLELVKKKETARAPVSPGSARRPSSSSFGLLAARLVLRPQGAIQKKGREAALEQWSLKLTLRCVRLYAKNSEGGWRKQGCAGGIEANRFFLGRCLQLARAIRS